MSMLLLMLGIWVGTQYVIGPFLVKFAGGAPERYRLPKLDWHELVSTLGEPFRQHHQQLTDFGFTAAAATRIPNVSAVIYVHASDGSMSELRHTKSFVSVCFIQCYEGETRLLVGNTPMASVYPRWDKELSFGFSNCRDIAALFERFKCLRSKMSSRLPVAVSAGDALQSTEDYLNAQLDYLIEKGYYAAPNAHGKRPLTIKGAVLMTWRLAWPSKMFRMYLARRRAERAVAADQ